jgi:hypothetical protein
VLCSFVCLQLLLSIRATGTGATQLTATATAVAAAAVAAVAAVTATHSKSHGCGRFAGASHACHVYALNPLQPGTAEHSYAVRTEIRETQEPSYSPSCLHGLQAGGPNTSLHWALRAVCLCGYLEA